MSTVKPLPKSLHTVTVLVRVATLIRLQSTVTLTAAEAVTRAVEALGLQDAEDPHALTEQARRQVASKFGGL